MRVKPLDKHFISVFLALHKGQKAKKQLQIKSGIILKGSTVPQAHTKVWANVPFSNGQPQSLKTPNYQPSSPFFAGWGCYQTAAAIPLPLADRPLPAAAWTCFLWSKETEELYKKTESVLPPFLPKQSVAFLAPTSRTAGVYHALSWLASITDVPALRCTISLYLLPPSSDQLLIMSRWSRFLYSERLFRFYQVL